MSREPAGKPRHLASRTAAAPLAGGAGRERAARGSRSPGPRRSVFPQPVVRRL